MRYREWVAAQSARGLAPHPAWTRPRSIRKQAAAAAAATAAAAGGSGSGSDSDTDSEDDDDAFGPRPGYSTDKNEGMTTPQLQAYCAAFTAGFYTFVNHDRIHSGTADAADIKIIGHNAASEDARDSKTIEFFSMQVSEDVLVKQMHEICERYSEGGVPLRPAAFAAAAAAAAATRVIKGKGAGAARRAARRNGGGGNGPTGAGAGGSGDGGAAKQSITTHTAAFVRCMLAQVTPTEGSARVTGAGMFMMSQAAYVDVDVARTLANRDSGGQISVAKALVKLREKVNHTRPEP
jgi:hypothetical protein